MSSVNSHKFIPLGDLEFKIMRILWDAQKPLDVRAVATALGDERAYTTVMTTLHRLHKKGYLTQNRDGRAFFYRARIKEDTVLQKMLARIANVFCNGDIGELVPQILGIDKKLTPAERERLKKFADNIRDVDND